MRPKLWVGLGALLLVAIAGLLFWGLYSTGHVDRTTIESVSIEATLNDEMSAPQNVDTDRSQVSCTTTGTPPDFYAVRVQGTILDPTSTRGPHRDRYDLVVEIGSERDSREIRSVDSGRTPFEEFLTVRDDESAEPGETVQVTVALRTDATTVDAVTKPVPVESGGLRCVDSQD